MELRLHPVAHAAMLPFKGGSQGSRRQAEGEEGYSGSRLRTPSVWLNLRLWKLQAECILVSP